MGRSRIIKEGTFTSRSLARCDPLARLTFIGMWTEADDAGRGIADARVLCGKLWSLDDDVNPGIVQSHIDQLAATGHLLLYMSAGDVFYQILNWEKHQAAAYRRGEAKHPDPYDSNLCTLLHADECKSVLEVVRREGIHIVQSAETPDVPATKPTPAVSDDDFNKFWAAYPRKESKKDARTALTKALRATTLDHLIESLAPLQKRAKDRPTEIKFIPLPASWLNKERWDDQHETAPVAARQNLDGRTWDPWSQCYISNHMVARS